MGLQLSDRIEMVFRHVLDPLVRFLEAIDSSRLHPVDRVPYIEARRKREDFHHVSPQPMRHKDRRIAVPRLEQHQGWNPVAALLVH
jgi:hypothetical protein